jgi:glycerol uptake operon antiterminator
VRSGWRSRESTRRRSCSGDIFRVLEKVGAARRRPPVCINVDLVSGVSEDASGLRFLSGRVEGVISTHRHVVELAKQAGLFTIHRLFAIDSGAVERGVKPIRRAQPHCVEILPALAYPEVAAAYPELLERPVFAGGLLKEPRRCLLHSRRRRRRDLDEAPGTMASGVFLAGRQS